jgi:hypothetical protein
MVLQKFKHLNSKAYMFDSGLKGHVNKRPGILHVCAVIFWAPYLNK